MSAAAAWLFALVGCGVLWVVSCGLAAVFTGKRPRRRGVAAGHGTAALTLLWTWIALAALQSAIGPLTLNVQVATAFAGGVAALALLIGAVRTGAGTPVPRAGGGLRAWVVIVGLVGLGIIALRSVTMLPSGAVSSVSPATLDAFGFFPIALVAMIVRVLSGDTEATTAPERPTVADVKKVAAREVERPWRAAALIDDPPVLTLPAREAAADASPLTRLWNTAGGAGPAPGALEVLSRDMHSHERSVWVLQDLPQPTETQALVATVLMALRRGRRVILVTQDAVATRSASGEAVNANTTFAAALRAALAPVYAAWRVGPLAVGQEELTQCMTDRVIPAVAVVSVQELSESLIARVWQAKPDAKLEYLFGPDVGLVAISGLDAGLPVEATHRILTLKRLFAALEARAARAPAIVTATSGRWALLLAAQATNERRAVPVTFDARSQGPVTVWGVQPSAVRNVAERWPRTAVNALVRNGTPLHVSDLAGTFDALDLNGDRPDLVLRRDLHFAGDASVAVLKEADLGPAWRQLRNRTATQADHHHALWDWDDTVLTRMFRSPSAFEFFERSGMLPHPRPAVGWDNAELVRAHVRRMLQEGEPDEAALRQAFPTEYAHMAAAEATPAGDRAARRYTMRRSPLDGRYARVALLARRAEALSPIRSTVTDRTWEVTDIGGGAQSLFRIDFANAMTRYYPMRIFSHGEHKYQVAEDPYNHRHSQLRVRRLPPGRTELTEPVLRIKPSVQGQVPTFPTIDTEIPGLRLRIATVSVNVQESVQGLVTLGPSGPQMTQFPHPVQSEPYPTRARAILLVPPPQMPRPPMSAYHHIAELIDRVLVSHIKANDEDIHVEPIDAGFFPHQPGGVLIVDRHPAGLGVALALDEHMCQQLVRWAYHIIVSCPTSCMSGCRQCCPERLFLPSAPWPPDKVNARLLLGM